MARPRSITAYRHPRCPDHPGATVWADGFTGARWSDAHRRPRYRCLGGEGKRGHYFTVPVAVRQPTALHPDSGRACPNCEHVYERHEGVKTGADFVFGHLEIARLFVRIGQGASLREASTELRQAIFRTNNRDPGKRAFKSIARGETSRQANLAVTYLDAFAPAVLAALHPKSWPEVIVIDSTSLTTRGYRSDGTTSDEADEKPAGNLKAGTIMVALDATGATAKPCLTGVRGGKDIESWKAFFSTLGGAPEWVIADLDAGIARAVRETWPDAILFHSRHHLEALMQKRAIEDGLPERVRLAQPVQLARPLPWTGSPARHWGDHPLFEALARAQRGPEEWAAFLAAIAEHIPPDRLALRSWIATNEVLFERQWRITAAHGRIPRSTGSLEGKIEEWLAPLERRAGRWQNARRLNLVLGLVTLRGRGEARETRYAKLVRAGFEAHGNCAHAPADNCLPLERYRGKVRQMSWWRTWQDRDGASLPRLVFESNARTRRREADEAMARARERLAERYAAEVSMRQRLGLPTPPSGRPKRPATRLGVAMKGRSLREFDDLLLEWDWDFNGDLDPLRLSVGSKERAAWRCALNPAHVWEAKISDRTYKRSACPFHMGNRVHPTESLAAYFPHLAREWHPTKNALRPDQVTRASGREIAWICEFGHEWRAVVYQRTLSKTGCPECFGLSQPAKARAAQARRRRAGAARVEVQFETITPPGDLLDDAPF